MTETIAATLAEQVADRAADDAYAARVAARKAEASYDARMDAIWRQANATILAPVAANRGAVAFEDFARQAARQHRANTEGGRGSWATPFA